MVCFDSFKICQYPVNYQKIFIFSIAWCNFSLQKLKYRLLNYTEVSIKMSCIVLCIQEKQHI